MGKDVEKESKGHELSLRNVFRKLTSDIPLARIRPLLEEKEPGKCSLYLGKSCAQLKFLLLWEIERMAIGEGKQIEVSTAPRFHPQPPGSYPVCSSTFISFTLRISVFIYILMTSTISLEPGYLPELQIHITSCSLDTWISSGTSNPS